MEEGCAGGSCPGRRTRSNLAVPDDYLDPRLTERRNPRTTTIDTASALEIVDLIGAEDADVPASVAQARVEIAQAIDLIEEAFRAGGRLLYVGAGTSGRLGVLDAAECPPTFGTPPEMVVGIIAGGLPALVKSIEGAEDDVNAGIGEMDARRVGPDDVVVGIAASGTTPFVRAALVRAQTLGARTALVSCPSRRALMLDTCDVVHHRPGRSGGGHGLHADEERDRDQARAQHAHHGRDDPAGEDLWESDGRPSGLERQAGRSEPAHRDGDDRARSR